MLNITQFRNLVLFPTLEYLGKHTLAIEQLMTGTMLTESTVGNVTYLAQHPNGPALGIYQIEPATHKDVWENFLVYKTDIQEKVMGLVPANAWNQSNKYPKHELLITSLEYSTAICRLIYLRKKEPVPLQNDWEGHAAYWKQHYNTPLGKGTPEKFVEACKKAGLIKED
jgi:hypothetical protein